MRAWRIAKAGEAADVYQLADIAPPVPGKGQVRVRVLGAAVNYPDVMMARGHYQVQPPYPYTPGVELCGEVLELGTDTIGISVGDRIVGTADLPAGAFAEEALMNAALSQQAPGQLDDAEAAALHIAYQTGWFGLHRRARLQRGDTLLVHAAAGGVGSAAVQLGKAAGATVIGVVGGSEKASIATELGCDLVLDRNTDDLVAEIKKATNGKGVDVAYDPVGGAAYDVCAKTIAFEGRILVVGFASGTVPSPGLNHALIKNYSIVGLHWGLYNAYDPAAITAAATEINALVAGGIRPLISKRVSLEDAPDAVTAVGEGTTTGRVVVIP
ncbi:putative oxidoreductase [Nostocoides australiense Ben110]|uniref:Putative oxidoreductase n=1 Tax=Nostocoides australiense Ben110 TaxID=1193182 RepID=W6K238_9MICO|nr:NADPH:quinone oxidoreductase family protein [Tetrasphaera australiensis]CCH75582.1 putative oxidoreductase [Tetrasphaera australiensis Ben110]